MSVRNSLGSVGVAAAAMAFGGGTLAQTADHGPGSSLTTPSSPARTIHQMQRPITVDVKERRLEDVIRFIEGVAQADLEPLWATDNGIGLDKEKPVTIKIENRPALTVLEAVLEKVQADAQQNSWQMTPEGTIEFGPKELLNKHKRLVVYDINDMLMVIPSFPDVPQIDLNSVLQQSKGGSGQSPFQNANSNQTQTAQQVEQRRMDSAKRIQDIITSTVEPEQWTDNGGDGATIRYWNSTFLVNAPDYIHREINGYPYWPSYTPGSVNGRRYVSLTTDQGVSKIDGFANSEVSAIAGGQPVSSAPKAGSPKPKP